MMFGTARVIIIIIIIIIILKPKFLPLFIKTLWLSQARQKRARARTGTQRGRILLYGFEDLPGMDVIKVTSIWYVKLCKLLGSV
jgi:uncharacterized membrane protein YqiK